MIPLRIRLSGFLSYQAEQTLDFEGTTVWMLAGPNGSGKSSVFDALTFALFGQHRSGASDIGELINKQSDGLSVDFEFAIGGGHYRIRRTLKKTARSRTATQQIYHRESPAGDWAPITETSKKTGFNDWITENIGLRYETFTSSVLLLQGQAERLLSQTPAERFKVLADVVDLERYQKLHERVDEQRKRLRAENEVLTHQLDGLPQVADGEISAVTKTRDAATAECNRLTAAVNELQTLELAAHRWADLQKRLTDLRQRKSKAERLVADSAAVERDATRLSELNAVIPLAERALTERGGVETARRTIDDALRAESESRQKVDAFAAQLESARGQHARLKESLRTDETEHARLANERPDLAAAVARFDSLAGQQNELNRLQGQLNALPQDLDQLLNQCLTDVAELELLNRAAPLLTRIHGERVQLRERVQVAREIQSRLEAVGARGTELSELLAKLQTDFEGKSRDLAQARDSVASAQTLKTQAASRLDAIRRMTDEPSCSLCGQPLTPAHREQELARRSSDADAAERTRRAAEDAHESARQVHDALARQIAETTRARDAERELFRETRQNQTQCTADIERLRRSLDETYAELPETHRVSIAPNVPADWTATIAPSDDDLATMRRRLGQAPVARQRLQALQDQQRSAGEWRSGIESLRRAISAVAVESSAAMETTRRNLARCEAELTAVSARIAARRKEVTSAERASDRASHDWETARGRLTEIAGTLQTERATLVLREAALNAAMAALPEAWRPAVERAGLADLDSWKRERTDLQSRRPAERRAELDRARAEMAAIAGDEARLAAEQDAIPADARLDVAAVDDRIRTARIELGRAEARLRERGEELFRLQERQTRHHELNQRRLVVRADHERHERLAELFGRNRLQMDLVRRAERQIVELANAALDRISGGSLHLRRRPTEDDRDVALDLECVNRAAGEAAIAVPFLSGSQRFRVAVSLALGIGRFASGQHRPMESVIIDEGFGALDRNGRQVMIQELQNLRGVLKCILLVSHQEEFADAFDDGYRFEIVDGATRVTRYARGFG